MQQSGNGMTARVVELAQALKDINEAEDIVEFLHTTGTQPELCGLPSVDVLEGIVNEGKDCYMQQLRALSPEELRALQMMI